MHIVATEILIIVLLVLANGAFAMAETAIVACRKSRLRHLAAQGDRRAQAALELAESPNRFLSTVQVGITLIGILAGAFGGATIAGEIAAATRQLTPLAPYADALGVGTVVLAITVLSVVLGELVPKRLALNHSLTLALALARPVRRLANLTSPVVHLLGALTDAVLNLVGFKVRPEPAVTEDEVRSLVQQGHEAGALFKAEKEIIEQTLALDRKIVGDLMTPRAKIIWLNAADPDETNWRKVVASGHTYFPVFAGQPDAILGVLSVKSLWANLALAQSANLRNLVTEPLFVPASMTALKLLETFKHTRKHLALVPDEFGNIQGLVTLVDVFEEIVGDIPAFDQPPPRRIVARDDGSWLVDAALGCKPLKQLLGLSHLPGEEGAAYETLGGFVLHQFQRIPAEGEHFQWSGFHFEVADMDRQRLDKILITPATKPAPPPSPPSS